MTTIRFAGFGALVAALASFACTAEVGEQESQDADEHETLAAEQ